MLAETPYESELNHGNTIRDNCDIYMCLDPAPKSFPSSIKAEARSNHESVLKHRDVPLLTQVTRDTTQIRPRQFFFAVITILLVEARQNSHFQPTPEAHSKHS